MKTCDEIAADVLSRRDEYYARRRSARKALTSACLCACLVMALGLALWLPDVLTSPAARSQEDLKTHAPLDTQIRKCGEDDLNDTPAAPTPDSSQTLQDEQEPGAGPKTDTGVDITDLPVISGATGFSACYRQPESGEVQRSMGLCDAMEQYGATVLYNVRGDVFLDGELVENFTDTLTLSELENATEIYTARYPGQGVMLFLAEER